MIYLYRFELVGVEDGTSHPGTPYNYAIKGPRHFLTNSEVPVTLDTDPGGPVFLPNTVAGTSIGIPNAVFAPTAISHDGLRLDGEETAGALGVSIPVAHPLAQHYSLDPGGYRLWLRIFRLDNGVVSPYFTGLAADFDYGEQMLTLQVQPLELVLAQQGLTAKHPRSCPKMVFSRECRARAYESALTSDGIHFYYAFAEQGFMGAVSADGLTVTVPEAANRPDGFFVGGVIMVGPDYFDGVVGRQLATRAKVLAGLASAIPYYGVTPVHGGYRRTVIAHTGSTLTLQAPLPPIDYATGKYHNVTLVAGCDGAQGTCINRFNNGRNFGGYPFIPLKDPNKVGILAAL